MRRQKLRRVVVLSWSVLVIALFCGCELLDMMVDDEAPSDSDKVHSFGDDLEASEKLSPVDEEGKFDVEGATNLGQRAYTGSTGDKDADAALGTRDVLMNFLEAERLIEEGRMFRDREKMARAIAMRPEDWSYRISMAVLLLEERASAEAVEEFREADWIIAKQERSSLQYANQGIQELEDARRRMDFDYGPYLRCYELHKRLATFYNIRYSHSNDPYDLKWSEQFEKDANNCKQ